MKKTKIPDSLTTEWKNSGSFMNKPARGWVHTDADIARGVTYTAKYIGCVKILKSVKTVSLEDRGSIIKIAMIKCCDKAGIIKSKKKLKIPNSLSKAFGEIFTGYCGENILITISKTNIKVVLQSTGILICDHLVENISFASAGEKDYSTLVSYIAKDNIFERACFVIDCDLDMKTEVIQTIGQAFEAKYKEFMNKPLKATEIPEKFTQPIFPEESHWDQSNSQEYTKIKRSETVESTGSNEYSCLQRGKAWGHSDAQMVMPVENLGERSDYLTPRPDVLPFVAGTEYSAIGNQQDYAAIYDNPIASPTTREQMLLDFNDNSASYLELCNDGNKQNESTYDNPMEILQQAQQQHIVTQGDLRSNESKRIDNAYDNLMEIFQQAQQQHTVPQERSHWEQFDDALTNHVPTSSDDSFDKSGYLVPNLLMEQPSLYAALDQRDRAESESDSEYQSPQEYQHPKSHDFNPPQTHYQAPINVNREQPKSNLDLNNNEWFHGQISRTNAEMMIKKDGQFLVRESGNSRGQYVLSGMKDGQHRHLLLVDPEGQIRTKDKVFSTVGELIAYHEKNDIPIISGGSDVHISVPVVKSKSKSESTSSMQI